MLKSFAQWLEKFLQDEGAVGFVKGLLGLIVFGAVLSALFGSTAIRTAFVIGALVLTLVLLTHLSTRVAKLESDTKEYRGLLSKYCKLLTELQPSLFDIKSWEQEAVIEANGDTYELITVNAVIRNSEARFFRLVFGAGWDQPKSIEKQVTARVRSLLVDGSEGPSFQVTSHWGADGKLDMVSHFHSPAEVDSEVRLKMEWTWPKKCVPLMVHKKPDPFVFYFRQPVERATYKVVLPKGVNVHWDVVALSQARDDFEITASTNAGRVEIRLIIKNLPADRRVGMLLELQR
ncbi:hypothetical protein [Lentzea sp. NEAU-D7]|uniref:hypothetical protein n=1 Tax=Lentzea sp. NEAU-D7 TaxID=2994667 RepID=UPI00224B03B5|nr:hypothetical protein [Lentzea sp. NEAU-D7]MCX2952483.1 hypothetical protein [Lentzea sp. NEAU-D7]